MRHDVRFALVRNGLQVGLLFPRLFCAWILHPCWLASRLMASAGDASLLRHPCTLQLCPPAWRAARSVPSPRTLAQRASPPAWQFPTVVAWSGVVRVEAPNEPMQGHLSLTGVPG